MATFVIDCPHCRATSAAYAVVQGGPHPTKAHHWNLFGVCPACGDPACVTMASTTTPQNPNTQNTNVLALPGYRLIGVYPAVQRAVSPEHVPKVAADAYLEGTNCLQARMYTAAAAMFRRCLEVALKEFCPEVEAWKLEKRIDKLATERKITDDIKEWAHRVRLDGNDALHEKEQFTAESAAELMEFTRLLLTYLYTLPKKVRLAIEASTASDSAS